MKYDYVVTGRFLRRPNRFIAYALVNGIEVVCHVKNTGRCKELLLPGVKLLLEFHPDSEAKGRKTAYSVIGVYKEHALHTDETLLINMDSQAPNQTAFEWLSAWEGVTDVKREVTYDKSRFDLAFLHHGKPAFMEVKGVTLEKNGVAMFPDAPTERGVKHLFELRQAASQGYEAFVFFLIQMKGVTSFTPNMDTHPAFGHALKDVSCHGVKVLAYDCLVGQDSLTVSQPVKIEQAPDCQPGHI